MRVMNTILNADFFDRDAATLAKDLLGKMLCRRTGNIRRRAQIIETEAYYIHEKGSHASLGYTEKRKALFMPAGTIYMYYARGGDSLNISAAGEGNAVLIKSAVVAEDNSPAAIEAMLNDNPVKNSDKPRPVERLCSGQTLLCKSLGLKVREWDGRPFDPPVFYLEDSGYRPEEIISAARLGIPAGRDEELVLRYIDAKYLKYTTKGRV